MPKVDDEDRWIFDQAATWPDLIRNNKDYDHPPWHYVDFPYFVGAELPVKFNRETAPSGDPRKWNVMQAVASCRQAVDGDASPEQKAIAYCWIFHLVGDVHQPLHSTALVSEKFADPVLGDKGGNLVLVTNGKNLHSLWDGFLGRQDRPQDVAKAVAELKGHPDWWRVDTAIDVPAWVQESHRACKAYVYTPEMLAAAKGPGEWQPITLPDDYLKASGDHARERVVAAGLRLAAVLSAKPSGKPPTAAAEKPSAEASTLAAPGLAPSRSAAKPSAKPTAAAATSGYWLNTNGNVRHNSTCKYFHNTKDGRECRPDEGKPCSLCGG